MCIPLQTGNLLEVFQTWTSLIFVSASNFIIPIVIYFKCKEFRAQYNEKRTLSSRQLDLLRQIHAASSKILDEIEKRHSKLQNSSDTSIIVVESNENSSHIPPIMSVEAVNDATLAEDKDTPPTKRKRGLLKAESTRMLFDTLEDDVPDPDMEDRMVERPTFMKTIKRNFRKRTISSPVESRPEIQVESTDDVQLEPLTSRTLPVRLPRRVTRMPNRATDDQIMDPENPIHESTDTIIPEQEIKEIDLPFLDLPYSHEEDAPLPEQQFQVSRVSRAHANRLKSLPANPKYRSPAFRSVPIWMPFSATAVARVLLVLTTLVTIGNIIFNLIP
jgi:hypothetical protein